MQEEQRHPCCSPTPSVSEEAVVAPPRTRLEQPTEREGGGSLAMRAPPPCSLAALPQRATPKNQITEGKPLSFGMAAAISPRSPAGAGLRRVPPRKRATLQRVPVSDMKSQYANVRCFLVHGTYEHMRYASRSP